jgi:cytochrome c peroxidase
MRSSTKIYSLVTFIVYSILLLSACTKFKNAKIQTGYLDTEIPDYGIGDSASNAKIHIGRVLFYDKNLSKNNSVACASCHKQEFAFADNVAFSKGFEHLETKRNSISIQNIGQNAIIMPPQQEVHLFWDGRESSLTSLIAKPIANHIEMGMEDTNILLSKLNNLPYYKNLLQTAHGTSTLTMEIIAQDMSLFLSGINSSRSRFDRQFMGSFPNGFTFSPLEEKGKILFNTTYQCSNCHHPSPGMYVNNSFFNIGLDADVTDNGRMNVTNESNMEGAFKVPDLHNVAVTAPYMHDGRFKTLEEVLEHYSHGIKKSSSLSTLLKNEFGNPIQLNITEEDKIALIAFLQSMTDGEMITNPLFSNPFKNK